ncbi:TIGR02679 family protein [Neobacillus sp. YIM B02564]|uniref:TIGR02679 family protein n=1 Tax=Neobacillus paridis TaxID=2803862 RepID=A0ABS1THF9_9BACI|nr:TIGR02679 family protein [Neobacillus paridis]MBL4950750.1 TIGR02679 family protein [Neobacillus paridis]
MNDKVQIFREEPGFLRLFTLFKEKYRSLGRVGGSVSIVDFSYDEVESIAGFLGQPVEDVIDKGKVSLLSFEKELAQTGFADYSLIELLEAVLGESILTKSEESRLEEDKEKSFFQELKTAYPEGSWWWDWIESKPADSRWIWSLYKQDAAELRKSLSIVFQAFQALPCKDHKFERLPVFAQRTTGNPHFFDNNQVPGKLLVHCLHVNQQLKELRETGMPKTTEELNELLSIYGLMRDDLWSFVTFRGLLAEGESGLHPVWQASVRTGSVLNVPFKELLKINKIWPANGNKVWVLENSSVCSTIVDEVPDAPVICTHGQFRTASWIVLDLLVESGCQLYYSGDLDPEGISMAQRLKDRYPHHVTYWRMDAESYMKTISDEDITSRIAKLDTVTSPELSEVAAAIRLHQKAGYQEGILAELINDIKEEFAKG